MRFYFNTPVKRIFIMFAWLAIFILASVGDVQAQHSPRPRKNKYRAIVSLTNGNTLKGVIISVGDSTLHLVGQRTAWRIFRGIHKVEDSTKFNSQLPYTELTSVKVKTIHGFRRGHLIGLATGFMATLVIEDQILDQPELGGFSMFLTLPIGLIGGIVIGTLPKNFRTKSQYANFIIFKDNMMKHGVRKNSSP